MGRFPERFLAEVKEILRDEYGDFLSAMQDQPHAALRINPIRKNAFAAAKPFMSDGASVLWEPLGFYADKSLRPGASIAHAAGAFYMQDASAMAPVAILNPKGGERVLDLCAAPGGKSGQIAAHMAGEGFLLSNEIEFSRAKILAGNLERLGVGNACITSASAMALSRKLPEFFDAVLVDAPCSGEGMFRRDPDAIDQWTDGAPAGCASRQAEILDYAAKTVRPGGRLVYSTCTFNRLENEGSVENFLLRNPDFAPEEFELAGVGRSKNGMIRLWPHRVRGEGHFAALLRKKDGRGIAYPEMKANVGKEEKALLSEMFNRLPDGNCVRIGDEVVIISRLSPDVNALSGAGVSIVRAGLVAASVMKNRMEPKHALAMALSPEDAKNSAALLREEALSYLAGEAIPVNAPKGWTLAVYEGMPLGWGKVNEGILKNHLPKGLRKRT